jgi:hypothetical protein
MKQYFVVDLEVSVGIRAPVGPSTESMGALNSLLVTAYPASPSSGRTTTGPPIPGRYRGRTRAVMGSADSWPLDFPRSWTYKLHVPPERASKDRRHVFTQQSADRIVWPFKPTACIGKLIVTPLIKGAKHGAGAHDEPDLAARPQTLPGRRHRPQDWPTTIAPASPQPIA